MAKHVITQKQKLRIVKLAEGGYNAHEIAILMKLGVQAGRRVPDFMPTEAIKYMAGTCKAVIANEVKILEEFGDDSDEHKAWRKDVVAIKKLFKKEFGKQHGSFEEYIAKGGETKFQEKVVVMSAQDKDYEIARLKKLLADGVLPDIDDPKVVDPPVLAEAPTPVAKKKAVAKKSTSRKAPAKKAA